MRGILLAALLSTLALAAPAQGATLYRNADGGWIHYETTRLPVYFAPSVTSHASLRRQSNAARREWSGKTVMDLPRVYERSRAKVIVRGRWLGHTGRSGYTAMPATGLEQAVVTLNLTYLVPDGWWNERATACHELGHVVGLDHAPGDCMGAGYFADASAHVGAASVDLLEQAYAEVSP